MDLPLVYVEWEDARLIDNDVTWVDAHAKSEYSALIVKQVGFLLEETDEGLILTHAHSPDVMAPRDQIPRGMVRRFVKLKLPRNAKI